MVFSLVLSENFSVCLWCIIRDFLSKGGQAAPGALPYAKESRDSFPSSLLSIWPLVPEDCLGPKVLPRLEVNAWPSRVPLGKQGDGEEVVGWGWVGQGSDEGGETPLAHCGYAELTAVIMTEEMNEQQACILFHKVN